jgi:hypothetical protein
LAKATSSSDDTFWILLAAAGGLGTSFFFLFTDVGRDFISNLTEGSSEAATIEDEIDEDPFQFYPYSTERTHGPVYAPGANPYLTLGLPYVQSGDPEIPYVHPAAADVIHPEMPDWYEQNRGNPIVDWLDKLLHGDR